ncbi:DEAD/DEAH box helicase [Capnocytophaga gingivalis]|uniref:DEAD/DEAH box helicase n=1 Tax=Capnocytophaga gingivalis TaxID=1017 RepID=UPI0028891EC1|nr:DEAD/DEAH box helicase [Capnocytophaga gingivalis]
MENLIYKIKKGEDIEEIISFVLNRIYLNGPINISDMEILSYLSLYQRDYFEKYKESIFNYIGAFYKKVEPQSLKDQVFTLYRDCIEENFNHLYTPVQADIIHKISNNKCFSFSAPTSTGKSYVFLNLIKESQHDVVIIVPSRALINEFYIKLNNSIAEKSVNILTFIDKINTKIANRNIFIVTPERCRELFKYDFNVDLFLFDEAQLSNEESKRGLYFDSIVRRCQKAFSEAKFVFAHPFIANPESQIKKNHFEIETSKAIQYKQKNVGQLFMCKDDKGLFYHFGVEKTLMGEKKVLYVGDPMEKAIFEEKSILFYVSKQSILNKSFLNKFEKYINLCQDLNIEEVDIYINKLKKYTGGDTIANKNYFSQMLSLLRKGIVIPHGSLPLQIRMIIENFTKAGFCRLCFATSTLGEGINMPFDIVFLDRLEASKPLLVKNLIGRAGRSTTDLNFDFGYVIIKAQNISKFREIISQDENLKEVSALDTITSDDDYRVFKNAILEGKFSDEYNLTKSELDKLESKEVSGIVKELLDTVFHNDVLSKIEEIDNPRLYVYFIKLYEIYLDRNLEKAEEDVLKTAIKIMLWRIYGKTFKNICWYRYSYASKTEERKQREYQGKDTNEILANYLVGYHDIPDKTLKRYPLFNGKTLARDVDYDTIICDTYDYLDKLIGFKLSDIYYAILDKYNQSNDDKRALTLAKYIKYGTDNERYIWMLRYGMSYEDIEVLDKYIEEIDEEEIVFKPSITEVSEEDKAVVERFI